MELNLTFDLNFEREKAIEQKVKENLKKQTKAKYEPTWEEVWELGYETASGSVKKGILQTRLTDLDRQRLLDVKQAIEAGELSSGVESLSKFTKSRALDLYKDLKELRRDQIIEQMITNKPDNYYLITTEEEFNWVLEKLADEEVIALDTETTGVDVWGSDVVVGLSMTLPTSDIHCYIPVRHEVDADQLPAGMVFEELKPYFEDRMLKKVLHNAKFDVHMLRKEGINVVGIEMDTMVAAHCLNENEPSFALKNLATVYGKYFGFEDKSLTYEELFGKGGFEKTPLLIGSIYACKDTHLTYQYYQWILTQMERVPQLKTLYFDIENKVLEVSIEMEKNGFLMDLEYAKQYQAELTQEIEALNETIKKGFGDINVNSNAQLANVIYNVWGIEDTFKGKVDASTLKSIVTKYKDKNPNVSYLEALLNYRELNKLLTTYIEPLPTKISPIDGRLHGSFNQSATKTGRFASNNPNLQNIPYPARPMFKAPTGKIIIGIDYSQIEPRVLAHISNDSNFKEAYIQGRDLYSEIASSTFKQPITECGDGSKWRKMAKVVLLGNMYGISAQSLAEQFKITLEEAEQIYKDFLTAYPDMARWFKEINEHANQKGYVETMWGRKRRFIGHQVVANKYKAIHQQIVNITGTEDYDLRNDKRIPYQLKRQMYDVRGDYNRVMRQSINAVIQGSAADGLKVAMIKVYNHLKKKGDEWKILATIHDELLIEIPASATIEEIEEIADIQRKAIKLSLPLKCDVDVMTSCWGKGMSLAEYKQLKQQ